MTPIRKHRHRDTLNPLEPRSYYSATSDMKLVHWPLMGGLLHLVQRGGDWVGPQPAHTLPRDVTVHPSTASVSVTILLCNSPLLCSFNVDIKGLHNTLHVTLCRHRSFRHKRNHHPSQCFFQQAKGYDRSCA